MSQRTIECPACAHVFELSQDPAPDTLFCPKCDTPIPRKAGESDIQKAKEIAPGFHAGQRVGNYEIEGLLGVGGMAVVFSGRQLSLNRPVAIKVLPKEYTHNPQFVERFESEATVLASLNHYNVVSVIDRGCEGETYFIVMELIEGETLKHVIQREKVIPQKRALELLHQILTGLAYAHNKGVVHRDIKPGNIMINKEGIIKIADFGLAHLAKSDGGLDLTRTSQTMGTLKYMAPEQLLDAKSVDCRADLYSMGVVLYEMITGQLPLGRFKMPSEINPSLDVRLDDAVLRALRMEPEERYQRAEDFLKDIDQIASTPTITAKEAEEEEAREETAAEFEVTHSLTGCPKCGHESPPHALKCEKCGASLEEIFEPCPNCGVKVRIDQAVCPAPNCGFDLAGHRLKVRQRVERRQLKVRKLYKEKKYDEALAELQKIIEVPGIEFTGVRASARMWVGKVTRKRDRYWFQTYEAGCRMVAEGRLDQAVQIWESLPPTYKDLQTRRAAVEGKLNEGRALLVRAGEAYKAGNLQGALDIFYQVAKIWPHNAEINRQ
ncbi:MAG TPA: serine/threonine-protein kinase, partial [Candidatus Brocadiia bacterium]|nr:serine/threonine-protein kinase [Candidatus Brocadiia bacterium]